jgi:hypothetical protein
LQTPGGGIGQSEGMIVQEHYESGKQKRVTNHFHVPALRLKPEKPALLLLTGVLVVAVGCTAHN